jgi:hypothetical protein
MRAELKAKLWQQPSSIIVFWRFEWNEFASRSETAKGLPKLDFLYIRARYPLIKGVGPFPFSSIISSTSPAAILGGHKGVADYIGSARFQPLAAD